MAQEMTVVLRNTSDEVWGDYFNGQYFVCDPGNTAPMAESVAKHFIGDWHLEDSELIYKETKRVLGRIPEDRRKLENPLQMELDKVVEPPNQDIEPKDTKMEPMTIIPQEIEPEFPDAPEAIKPRKHRPQKKKAAKKEVADEPDDTDK